MTCEEKLNDLLERIKKMEKILDKFSELVGVLW